MSFGDDYPGFLAGASMEPATYQDEQVMVGRAVLRISKFGIRVGKQIMIDIYRVAYLTIPLKVEFSASCAQMC